MSPKARKLALTIAMALVALIMLAGGGAKLTGVPQMHASFAALGLPAWFGYFIGACEVAGAIGLFIPRLSALAAAGIALIMIGAAYFHVAHTPIAQAVPAVVVLLLCGFIIQQRRRSVGSPAHA